MTGGYARFRRAIQVLIASVFTIFALIVLLAGWFAGTEFLVRYKPFYYAMVPTTAVCFAILGCANILASRGAARHLWLLRALLAVVVVIAVLNLVLHQFPAMSSLDQLLGFPLGDGDRMADGTAYGLLLAAYCIYCLGLSRPIGADMYRIGVVMGLTLSFALLVGHSFVKVAAVDIPIFRETSFFTALLFLLLFIGLALPDPRVFALDKGAHRRWRH